MTTCRYFRFQVLAFLSYAYLVHFIILWFNGLSCRDRVTFAVNSGSGIEQPSLSALNKRPVQPPSFAARWIETKTDFWNTQYLLSPIILFIPSFTKYIHIFFSTWNLNHRPYILRSGGRRRRRRREWIESPRAHTSHDNRNSMVSRYVSALSLALHVQPQLHSADVHI